MGYVNLIYGLNGIGLNFILNETWIVNSDNCTSTLIGSSEAQSRSVLILTTERLNLFRAATLLVVIIEKSYLINLQMNYEFKFK